jgi:hypothetical protein
MGFSILKESLKSVAAFANAERAKGWCLATHPSGCHFSSIVFERAKYDSTGAMPVPYVEFNPLHEYIRLMARQCQMHKRRLYMVACCERPTHQVTFSGLLMICQRTANVTTRSPTFPRAEIHALFESIRLTAARCRIRERRVAKPHLACWLTREKNQVQPPHPSAVWNRFSPQPNMRFPWLFHSVDPILILFPNLSSTFSYDFAVKNNSVLNRASAWPRKTPSPNSAFPTWI